MTTKNTSHLAGEFLVAGELSRRGYPVSITMGNAKSIDIYASSKSGTIKIDAKAGRSKSNFPIKKVSVKKDMQYIFCYLQSDKKIEQNEPPEYFIASGKEILSKNLTKTWNTREGIPYSTLNTEQYKERWDKLPQPL
ncbi:MAG: hypothetical protein JRI87_08200 [Deltaproteobacteria bacterium]|nr:hypothetical protein [Deltaproteobacteria bacterium]